MISAEELLKASLIHVLKMESTGGDLDVHFNEGYETALIDVLDYLEKFQDVVYGDI